MEKGGLNEIRYFSMFTGVGGFELGLQQANERRELERASDRCNNKYLSEQTRSRKCLQPNGTQPNNKGEWSETECQKSISKDFRCVGFSEIDKYASQVLKTRYPNIPNFGDATKINPNELPDFDMLCGGFPCQSFSIAGKRRGFQDTRGTMFFEIARILEVKRPRLVLLENVKGLLNHNKGETFKVILQTLEELRYEIQWMVLNSKFFGVPQNRERVFIIGSVRGKPRPEILPFREDDKESIEESRVQKTRGISKCLTARYWKQGQSDQYVGEPITHPTITGAIGRQRSLKQVAQAQRIRNVEGVSQSLQGEAGGQGAKTGLYAVHSLYPRTGNPKQRGTGHLTKKPTDSYALDTGNMQGLEFNTMKIRRLTPLECQRLQGFPDDFYDGIEMSDTQKYKQMGNAVTTNVVKAIGERLK